MYFNIKDIEKILEGNAMWFCRPYMEKSYD